MIPRILMKQCRRFACQYPVITITGPRQSGKTTLAKTAFPQKPYVNLEEPDQRQYAHEDPRGFLNQYPGGAILDEIQRTPHIPSYLQTIVDESRRKGLFILTGSQQFEISHTITQSLAGRTALLKLLPLSYSELSAMKYTYTIDQWLLNGFYPRLYNEKLTPYNFYMNYFETYIQRDLRNLSQIDNLMLFQKFVQLLAGRVGQLLNYSNIANDLGISQPTIKKWVSLLEASYIVFLLPPFSMNIRKRLIKTPKIYFYDVGLVSYLLGIESARQMKAHPLRGNLFENFILMEFIKDRFNHSKAPNIYFYRDRSGNEIDLVIENPLSIQPIEIKAAETINAALINRFVSLIRILKKRIEQPSIIYGGGSSYKLHNISLIPWNTAAKNLF